MFHFFRSATGLEVDGDEQRVQLSDGTAARPRTTIVATGVDYRRLGIPELEELSGRGVFYGAAVTEARSMAGQAVHVVGGGNSAGQAALHLAKYARHVSLLVRGADVSASMSEYLIEQIRATRNVDIIHNAVVTGARAVDARLTEIEITDGISGTEQWNPCHGLFVLIGASPHTDWLDGVVARDDAGFVTVGTDATGDADDADEGHHVRHPLETSRLGVFAVGDIRRGSIKRVATAVGDGAAVVAAVHHHTTDRMHR